MLPEWLEKWSKPDDRSALSVSLLSLQQREQQPAVRARPPWALAEHSARDVAALLSPPKGRDRFLHNSEASLTDCTFVDLLAELSPSETATLVLIDPWIDELGLELLGNGGPYGAVIHVLTSCLMGQEERISRLRSFLRAAAGERPPTIGVGVVRIEAAGIVPPERYLLMVDEGGRPLQGFQLSRSLSLGEVSRPLFLNEIHRSVLPHVVEFAKQLRRCEPEIAGPGPVYETIWPEPPTEVVRIEQAHSPEKIESALDQLADPSNDVEFDQRWASVSGTLAVSRLAEEHLLREIPGLDDRLVALLGSDLRLAGLEHRDRRRSMERYALLEALRGSLAVQYHRAWDIIWRWHSTSSWWPVVFAAKRLVQTSASGFVDALSGCFDRIAHARPADPSNELRLACAEIMLHILTRYLRVAERFVAPLESALLRGGHSLIRALGSSAIGHRLVKSEAPVRPDELVLLQPLSTVERSLAVAEWVFHIRVKANRAGGVEQERDRSARLAMFEVLKEDWQHFPDWRQIVRKLDGPTFGIWCVSTFNDLLMPLVKQGRLAWPEVVEFWARELADRWQQLLVDQHHFYVGSDPPLTQLVATLIARDWPESSGFIERARIVFEEAAEILERPFARSTDYGRWDRASKVVLWIQTFARLVAAEVPSDTQLTEFLRPASDKPTSVDDDPSKLLWFARAVQDQSERKAIFSTDEVLAQLGSTKSSRMNVDIRSPERSNGNTIIYRARTA